MLLPSLAGCVTAEHCASIHGKSLLQAVLNGTKPVLPRRANGPSNRAKSVRLTSMLGNPDGSGGAQGFPLENFSITDPLKLVVPPCLARSSAVCPDWVVTVASAPPRALISTAVTVFKVSKTQLLSVLHWTRCLLTAQVAPALCKRDRLSIMCDTNLHRL